MRVGDLVKMRVAGTKNSPGGAIPDSALGIVVDLDGGNDTWVTVSWDWEGGKVSKTFIRDLRNV